MRCIGKVFVFVVSLHALQAVGQVRCTMPNGVVIEQRLANVCPVGAVKGETFDGKPAPIAEVKPEKPLKPAPAPEKAQKPQNLPQKRPAPQYVPLDADANVYQGMTREQVDALVVMTRLSGFKCDTVSAATPLVFGGPGFSLMCNKWRYSYKVQDRGGRWRVIVD